MRGFNLKKLMPLPGVILGLMLIGLLLLSALTYYRAIKVQRFLEPALALSKPRLDFTNNLINLILDEFGKEPVDGIDFVMGSIMVEESLLYGKNVSADKREKVLGKIARILLAALGNEDIRPYIDRILVSARLPVFPGAEPDKKLRLKQQEVAEETLHLMYRLEPALEKEYGLYFIASAMPVNASTQKAGWIEFKIIRSEMIHIEVLQKLQKYVQ